MTCFTHYPSPFGPICLVSDGTALTGLWMHTEHFDTSGLTREDDLPLFDTVRSWLDAYFAGNPGEIDSPSPLPGRNFSSGSGRFC